MDSGIIDAQENNDAKMDGISQADSLTNATFDSKTAALLHLEPRDFVSVPRPLNFF
jgi:hypothetical protein